MQRAKSELCGKQRRLAQRHFSRTMSTPEHNEFFRVARGWRSLLVLPHVPPGPLSRSRDSIGPNEQNYVSRREFIALELDKRSILPACLHLVRIRRNRQYTSITLVNKIPIAVDDVVQARFDLCLLIFLVQVAL